METWTIKNHTVEYLEDSHTYLVDGIILPSITTILKVKFGNKYAGIDESILKKAADNGTKIHETIENFYKYGVEDITCKELKNIKFLQKHFKFKVIDNEVPIILFKDNIPVACGRLDLVLEENIDVGLGDIKRTSALDKEYLAYQLNLYRIGYQQCYEKEIKFLRGIHLRNDVRKYIEIPINEKKALELLEEYYDRETTGDNTVAMESGTR